MALILKSLPGCLILTLVYALIFGTYYTPLITIYFFFTGLSGFILNAIFFGFAIFYTSKYPINHKGKKWPIVLPVFISLWFLTAVSQRLLVDLPYINSEVALSELDLKDNKTLILQTNNTHRFFDVSLTLGHIDQVVKVGRKQKDGTQYISSTRYAKGDKCYEYRHKSKRDFLERGYFDECLGTIKLLSPPDGIHVKQETAFYKGYGCCNKLIISNLKNGKTDQLLTLETGKKSFLSLLPSFPIKLKSSYDTNLWEFASGPFHGAHYGASIIDENQIAASLFNFAPKRFLERKQLNQKELHDVIAKANEMSQSNDRTKVQNSVVVAYVAANKLNRKYKTFDKNSVAPFIANIGYGKMGDLYSKKYNEHGPGSFFIRLQDEEEEKALDLIFERITKPNICNACNDFGGYIYHKHFSALNQKINITEKSVTYKEKFEKAFFELNNLDAWQYEALLFFATHKMSSNKAKKNGVSSDNLSQRSKLFKVVMQDNTNAFSMRFRALRSSFGRMNINELISLSKRLHDFSDEEFAIILDEVWLRNFKDDRVEQIKDRVKIRRSKMIKIEYREKIDQWLERK